MWMIPLKLRTVLSEQILKFIDIYCFNDTLITIVINIVIKNLH